MYTLKEITELGHKLLDMNPGVVQKYKILKDIIGVDRNSSEYIDAKKKFFDSEQYIELEAAREENCMWGQFHTENTKVKRVFKTTEVAMKRCQSLGLDKEDHIIKNLVESMVKIANGQIEWPDSKEVTNVWMDIGFRWVLYGCIAMVDKFNPVLDTAWKKFSEFISGCFVSGDFKQQDHDKTFLKLAVHELTNAQIKRLKTTQFINQKYCPIIIGATTNKLPYELEKRYITWLIENPKGIYYVSNRPYENMPDIFGGEFMAYMRVHSLLNPFHAWKEKYREEVMNSLRSAAGDDGLWHPGRGAKSLYILKSYEMHQLAYNWRNPVAAKIDFSIFILNFIRTALGE